jgi:hypothetical protein
LQIVGESVNAVLPRLILSAVRFIPNIVDSTGMADKMVEILQVRCCIFFSGIDRFVLLYQ